MKNEGMKELGIGLHALNFQMRVSLHFIGGVSCRMYFE
jgi:hypothetical protein